VLGLLTTVPSVKAADADQRKGAERLMDSMKPIKTVQDVQAINDGDKIAMACPKCKTISYTYVDYTTKGVNKDVKTVSKDACPGCDTKIITTGVGKQSKDEIQHTCKACGSHDAFCCVVKSGGTQ